MGIFARISRLRTCLFEAMAMSGRITKSSMRWYSMAGMIATSALPVRNCSAHWDGTVNDKSYLPRRGPLVKPQTSGAVFRYWTIEMRSFVTIRELTLRFQYNKAGFSRWQASGRKKRLAALEGWNSLNHGKDAAE